MREFSIESLIELRTRLDKAFSKETAHPSTNYTAGSSGHCAAVSKIVHDMFGGEFVSARFAGGSHWFNRIGNFDVDLTGDQYGFDPVRIASAGELYENARVRDSRDMKEETIARSRILFMRASLED